MMFARAALAAAVLAWLTGCAQAWTCEDYHRAKAAGITAESPLAKAYFALNGQPTAADAAKARRCEAAAARKATPHARPHLGVHLPRHAPRHAPAPRPAPLPKQTISEPPAEPAPLPPQDVEPAPPLAAAEPAPEPPAIVVRTTTIAKPETESEDSMASDLVKWIGENIALSCVIGVLLFYAGKNGLPSVLAWFKRMGGYAAAEAKAIEAAVAKVAPALAGQVTALEQRIAALEAKAPGSSPGASGSTAAPGASGPSS